MNSLLAKIFGWLQFGVNTIGQVAGSGGIHGWGWLQLISALGMAIAVHAASNVGKVTPVPAPASMIPATVTIGDAHIKQ